MLSRHGFRLNRGASILLAWRLTAAVVAVSCCCPTLEASDHADAPHEHDYARQDANLTDLHAFVVGANLVIALSTNPGIPPSAASYRFPTDVTFEVHIDNHSVVSPDDPYGMGGTILAPDKIQQDITFRIRFGDDGTPRMKTVIRAAPKTEAPVANLFAGLRDDPFIRGPREGRNVAAIVFEVPLASVASRESTILIWATSKVDGLRRPYQDLVGRALRSMMPENEEMNSLRPRRQAGRMGVPPDVMIYNTALPAAFPNGRALADDVVDIVNDPRLLGNDAPFPSANDVPFLDVFPYLAPPHPPR